ncbi:MAG: TetR/AcrR family transcriptional regulator [Butyricicoccus sp.]
MKQDEKTKLTVSKILEAALEEFGTNGYAGGTINHICKRGINKGLIYHNFKDKDDLYLACLKISCGKLVALIEENDCASDQLKYMNTRMYFFQHYPREARIFFEAILQPQEELRDRIQEILQPFENINEQIYRAEVSSVTLRDGVTEECAIGYFRQMQRMFNGYFSSPAYRHMTLDKQIKEHETSLPKLLDFMLFGIAKGEKES